MISRRPLKLCLVWEKKPLHCRAEDVLHLLRPYCFENFLWAQFCSAPKTWLVPLGCSCTYSSALFASLVNSCSVLTNYLVIHHPHPQQWMTCPYIALSWFMRCRHKSLLINVGQTVTWQTYSEKVHLLLVKSTNKGKCCKLLKEVW